MNFTFQSEIFIAKSHEGSRRDKISFFFRVGKPEFFCSCFDNLKIELKFVQFSKYKTSIFTLESKTSIGKLRETLMEHGSRNYAKFVLLSKR